MAETFEPIETEAGIISGRDAIFLDEVLVVADSLELRGELNSILCSGYKGDAEWIKYNLKFSGVLAFKMIELDLREGFGKSSFDRVIDSEWLKELRGKSSSFKIKPDHEHYLVFTYDDVFDVICRSFELKLLESRPKDKA